MSDDLIRRKAAIDVLDEQIEQCDKSLSSFDISMRDEFAVKVERASLVAFRERLEYLPPAQPEPCEIEQYVETCEECGFCDTISRRAAIDAVNRLSLGETDAVRLSMRISDYLKRLQPAEPKTGKWIKHIDDLFPEESTIECDQCHEHQPLTIDDNFCPNCGAKMTEGDAE